MIRGRKFEAETIAWANKVTKIDKEFPYHTIYNVDVFLKSLKTQLGTTGYSNIKMLWIGCAESHAASMIPIIGTADFTSTGFQNYNANPIFGLTGNGIGTIDSKVNLNTLGLPSHDTTLLIHYNSIHTIENVGVQTEYLSALDGTNQATILTYGGDGNPTSSVRAITGFQSNQSMPNIFGVSGYSFQSMVGGIYPYAGGFKYTFAFNDVVQDPTNNPYAGTSYQVPTINLGILSRNTNGTFSPRNFVGSNIDLIIIARTGNLDTYGWNGPNHVALKTIYNAFRTSQKKYYSSYKSSRTQPYVHLWLGQSLSTGYSSRPGVVSTTQPYNNIMLSTGVWADYGTTTPYTGLTQMVEAQSSQGYETPMSGMANFIGSTNPNYVVLGMNSGVGGKSYNELRSGTLLYSRMLQQAMAGVALTKSNISYDIAKLGAVHLTHGEQDEYLDGIGSPPPPSTYDTKLTQWQIDIQKDLSNIYGSAYCPFLIDQTAIGSYGSGHLTPYIAPLQLKVCEDAYTANPDAPTHLMVCPKYFFPYDDGLHLYDANTYRWLGEYHGKVYKWKFIDNKRWTGLRPLSVTRTGATIDIIMYVPVLPLQFNTTLVTDPNGFKGFEYSAGTGGNTPTISTVTILNDGTNISPGVNTQTVRVTLTATPTGTGQEIKYAWTSGTTGAGPTTGNRGNLCDSDVTTSPNDYDMKNWCVTFKKSVL